MNPQILLRKVTPLFLVASLLASFALAHRVEAKGGPFTCNTATGFDALFNITTGVNNSAFGCEALFADTTGSNNTATGSGALKNNDVGQMNTAVGAGALLRNNDGGANTAVGDQALMNNLAGGDNTAVGFDALANSSAVASDNTALGARAGINIIDGSKNIDIGNEGVAGDSNTIRIGDFQGATFIAGIYGFDEGGTIAQVTINTDGRLGTQAVVTTSSRRFKKEIKPMDKASEVILALKPVTFHFKKETDPKGIPQFGLVAEDVEKVNPDLVVRDNEGKPYSVRYDAVNAMLLNEFLKEHHTVQQQEATIAQLKKGMESLTAQLKEQAAQIQKVSAQLELNKPAPQTVANNQ